MHMGYDQKAFTAAVVDMAVKGYLTIEEQGDEYTLRRTGKDQGNLDKGDSAWVPISLPVRSCKIPITPSSTHTPP